MADIHFKSVQGSSVVTNSTEVFQWADNVNYPRFTLVRDLQTNSLYISVSYVPAGILLSNSTYWHRVASTDDEAISNADILALFS